MEKERPPDPGDWDLDTSSTEDKINAYDAIASSYQAGIQPAIFLTHSFLQDHPILLEEGYLTVNWDRIPGLYTWTDKLLTVSITDAQWEKWGWPGGWMAWEPDTRAGNFIPNMAVVVCKGVFHDAWDPQLQDKVGHFMTIARVPDCVELLPFDQLREAFNNYNEVATAVRLVRLHHSNVVFPDVYLQFYSKHFTIMGLLDPEIRFGTADEFVGGYLVHWHIVSSGRKAHTMLPPSYVQGAKCPRPSPMYIYRPGGTGTLGQHPPIHVIFMAAIGRVLPSPSRFCIVETLAKEWLFNDAPVPWILPTGYRNPNETVPDFLDDDNEAGGSLSKGSGSTPLTGPSAKVMTVDGAEEEDDGFETVDDGEGEPGNKVVISIPVKKVAKLEGSGLAGKTLMFESEEEDDPEVKKQIEAALDKTGPLGDLMLSEPEDESESESSDDDDDDEDLNETKQYYESQEEGIGESGSKPSSPKAVNTDPVAITESAGNPTGSRPDAPSGNTPPTKPGATKGKGPSSESSGKASASKLQLSATALGVQERTQSTLFGAAALAQATGMEEDTVRRLENYTSLLTGLQKLVVTMASGYEVATEDVRSLVASTLDVATQGECTFVAGASQSLADWTAKYQHAMSQGENQSMHDQLACWNRVREARIALSRHITTLTTEHGQSTVSGEIFRTLIPACFQHVRVRTEATFSEVNATLPSLLCRFVAPDQAGQIMASIFTCLCNYNTEICGMAMAQTVVPVYTIPNTCRVQQSLWESLCWIIPGNARTSESELCSFEPTAPRNIPVGQSDTAPGAGSSGNPGTGTVGLGNPQNVAVSLSTCEKDVTQETHPAGLPDGIPPVGSNWAVFKQHILTVNLADDGDPPDASPPETSTLIKATPESGRRHSKKKLNVSKIKATHLLFDMQDRQEKAWRSVESENQAAVPDRISGKGRGSGGELPHRLPVTLPDQPGKDGMPTVPTDPTPEAPKQDNKRPHDDDDEIMEVPDEDKPAGPPKKKKKKKKNKDPKDAVPNWKGEDDGACPSTSMVEPEDVADEATPVPASTEVPAEETKAPKKKKKQKKEDAKLEKFRLEQREAKAKEMSKVKHRKLQHEQDFWALRNYQKSIHGALLETINGADHSSYLLERFQKENNYMNKKCSHKWNLMTVERLLTHIAKYADEPTKRLKEAQQVIKSTFPMVQRMPSGDKCTPEFSVRVLLDCDGNLIDCDHQEYRKEQNIGLHDVVSPAAMVLVTVRETYIMGGIPTTIKANNAYCPFCAYTASNHRAVNNHVRMHLRAIMVCGWPGCYFVHMQSKRMIEHSAEAHGMARAKPAREKGGD